MIFGTDGYQQDEGTRLQVDRLRELLADTDFSEVAFGLDERDFRMGLELRETERGRSWAMLVEQVDELEEGSNPVDELGALIWKAHQMSRSA